MMQANWHSKFVAALALACAACPRTASAAPADMWLQSLAEIDPLAVCNDGSPAGYYYQAATTQPSVWLVYLEGGMWCYDETSCNFRWKYANYSMSSLSWGEQFKQGGIFEDNPALSPLAGANRIFVTYCSSDSWAGDGANYGFQFRGARIVDAVLESLVKVHGMGSNGPGEKLIFGGCSAGGRGAMFSLDYVPSVLASFGATEMTVVGLLDAALWVDIDPLLPTITSQQCQTASLIVMANATGRMGEACALAYPGNESWKCLYGQYRAPFLQQPYLLQASQEDVFQIEINTNAAGQMLPPSTPAQFAWASTFQKAMKEVVAGLPTPQQPDSGIFSPACFHHCVTDAEGFWGLKINGVSFKDAFTEWFEESKAPLHIVDPCTGFKCGECSSKRSDKRGKAKPGHGAGSPAELAAAAVAKGMVSPPPAPAHNPWGWTPAQAEAQNPTPEICVAAGLAPGEIPPPPPAPVAPPPGTLGPELRGSVGVDEAAVPSGARRGHNRLVIIGGVFLLVGGSMVAVTAVRAFGAVPPRGRSVQPIPMTRGAQESTSLL